MLKPTQGLILQNVARRETIVSRRAIFVSRRATMVSRRSFIFPPLVFGLYLLSAGAYPPIYFTLSS